MAWEKESSLEDVGTIAVTGICPEFIPISSFGAGRQINFQLAWFWSSFVLIYKAVKWCKD